jgi:hypothetical protein
MSEGDETVGYGKPPQHSRFKKGQSGNPGGKRKPVPASAGSALAQALARRVTVAGDDGDARMSQLEAVMDEMVRKARAGDARCIKLVVDGLRDLQSRADAQQEFVVLCRKEAKEDARRHRREGCDDADETDTAAAEDAENFPQEYPQ